MSQNTLSIDIALFLLVVGFCLLRGPARWHVWRDADGWRATDVDEQRLAVSLADLACGIMEVPFTVGRVNDDAIARK
jgi:hypothetical protein